MTTTGPCADLGCESCQRGFPGSMILGACGSCDHALCPTVPKPGRVLA